MLHEVLAIKNTKCTCKFKVCYIIYRGYENPPKPDLNKLHEAGRQFYQGVLASLKSKSTNPVYVPFEHNIWRYITYGKGRDSDHVGFRLYSIPDLCRLPLPAHWWYYLDNYHGEGITVQLPMKIKPVLRWTLAHSILKNNQLSQAPRMPVERLCINILKHSCNSNNLGDL